MAILVVGGSGFLGGAVVRRALVAGYRVAATHLTRPPDADGASWFALDVRDRGEVADLVEAVRPDVVVNAAFRQAEWTSTADGAAHVALAAASVGARLVHVSSDAVFSGAAAGYDETSCRIRRRPTVQPRRRSRP